MSYCGHTVLHIKFTFHATLIELYAIYIKYKETPHGCFKLREGVINLVSLFGLTFTAESLLYAFTLALRFNYSNNKKYCNSAELDDKSKKLIALLINGFICLLRLHTVKKFVDNVEFK